MRALAVALLLAAPVKLDALLARVAKEYGGKARVVRETGTLETMRGLARTVRVFAAPDRLRVEIR